MTQLSSLMVQTESAMAQIRRAHDPRFSTLYLRHGAFVVRVRICVMMPCAHGDFFCVSGSAM